MTPPLPPLVHPDLFHLTAAEGWLGLGDWQSAKDELEEIAPHLRAHPDVLRMRWIVYAAARHWELAAEVTATLARLLPNEPEGWSHHSIALYRLGRTAEARQTLLDVLERFPTEPILRYNLACYECQLGCLPAAREQLVRAFALAANAEYLRHQALADPDLEPLWPEIPTL